jgi:hypothetical protein
MEQEAVGLGYGGAARRPEAPPGSSPLAFVKAEQQDDLPREIELAVRSESLETSSSATVVKEEEEEDAFSLRERQREEEALRAARVQEGRLRAQAILRRFEEQQASFLLLPLPAATVLHPAQPSDLPQVPSIFVEQRRRAAIRERRRQQEAWSRNFSYVERKHEAEVQAFPQSLAAAQEREAVAARDYQRNLSERQRKQKELTTQAGIGTKKRQRAEAYAQSTRAVALSAALYLTGIPVEEDESSSRPDLMLRQIFGAYGQLTKIHLYRDKTTGALKGDGLVVYQVPTYAARDTLVETVCGQVSPYCRVYGGL